MYRENLEELDGYWFDNIHYETLVSYPTDLVFEKENTNTNVNVNENENENLIPSININTK